MNPTATKNGIMGRILRFLTIFLIWCLGGYVLWRYEYLQEFSQIDNVTGMLPVVMVLLVASWCTVLILVRFSPPWRPVAIVGAISVCLTIALFPPALRGNWWINSHPAEAVQATPDFSLYEPFTGSDRIATLDEPATLRLTEDLPQLDGASALYPLYAAFAQAAYDEDAFTPDRVICTNTLEAYDQVIAGNRDVIFVAGPSAKQSEQAKAAGVTLVFTPIGREAFVFLTGKNNPVSTVTHQQLRNIYSGKTARWQTLGWRDGGSIVAFQRPEGSGSQTGLQKMIMRDLPIQVPQPLPDPSLIETNSLLRQVSAEWQGVQPALGYSYRFYATTIYPNDDAKLLAINGVDPTVSNIQNNRYPYVADFYAVTNGEPAGNTKRLISFILSPQGQQLIEQTGYTPLLS